MDGVRFAVGAAVIGALLVVLLVFGGNSPDEAAPAPVADIEEAAPAAQEDAATEAPADPAEARRAAAQIDEQRIINADSEPHNWLAHGRDYGEQRYSPLQQVNEETVGELGLAWHFDTNTLRGLESSPIVIDGVMYLTASWAITYALDAKTGELLWEYDPETPRDYGRYACCDVVNRGVAVWNGKVYVATLEGYLVALDAGTGEVIWKVMTVPGAPYTITAAPRIVGGKVIIGNGGGEYGVRGYFSAYDAETGDQIWRFYVVPGDPSKPYEHPELEEAAKTWKGDIYWKRGGGGTVWDSMAYDPELNTLYVGTGNGSPWNIEERSPGGGDNLYISSILAINPDDGSLKWHYQTTPGDTWDFTATQHIILADMEIDGKMRKVAMQAPKNGFFYVLDRETGELLKAPKYMDVLWASHVDMETGRPVENDTRWGKEYKIYSPIPTGAHNWHPMAYNPDTGLVYIPSMDNTSVAGPEEDFEFKETQWNTGLDWTTQTDAPPEAFRAGYLQAFDPVKGETAWKVAHWGNWNGGMLTTAGNLVFQGTGDGFFKAYRATDGKLLWQHPMTTGVIAPAVTYMVDGEQYVTVLAGWGGAFALAYGRAAKKAGSQADGKVMTFKLGGNAPMPEGPMAKDIPEPPALIDDPELIKKGSDIFASNCAVCHGVGAVSGGVIPDLRHSDQAIFDMYNEIVLEGLLAENGMANFSDVVDADDVEAIKAYVISRAHEGDVPTAIPDFPDHIKEALGLPVGDAEPAVDQAVEEEFEDVPATN